jgi:hypothetical protein
MVGFRLKRSADESPSLRQRAQGRAAQFAIAPRASPSPNHQDECVENRKMKTLAIADFELVVQLAEHLSVAAVARERDAPASQVSRASRASKRPVGCACFTAPPTAFRSPPTGTLLWNTRAKS